MNASHAILANGALRRGDAYDAKHLYDAALADFTEAIRLDPTNLGAYNDRGCTLANKGEYHKAEEQYNLVLRMAPTNVKPGHPRSGSGASPWPL